MMKEYKRAQLTITEFEAEDIITTSGVSPQSEKTITMNSPNYSEDQKSPFSWNWTLWQ